MKNLIEVPVLSQKQHVLLLVDDEPNILATLIRLLRCDSYRILTASSGAEALEIMQSIQPDVIIADQRMLGMTGVEFFSIVRKKFPHAIRIVLSGYTELQSVTDAVNRGQIYKFLTKPWDDIQLKEQVTEAFRYKDMIDADIRVSEQLHISNTLLQENNTYLSDMLKKQALQTHLDSGNLAIFREMLEYLPLPVIGIDEDDVVVLVNKAAQSLAGWLRPPLGENLKNCMPILFKTPDQSDLKDVLTLDRRDFEVSQHTMGKQSQSRGRLVTFTEKCETLFGAQLNDAHDPIDTLDEAV